MQIDATKTSVKHGKLMAEEKKFRWDNGLCLYCGVEGHKAGSCPNRSEAAKKAGQKGGCN